MEYNKPHDPAKSAASFHDIVIEIPNMTIQNVGPQDITASASLADVYNAGQSINGRWAVQSCKPALNTDGLIINYAHRRDSDGYIFGISYHITAIDTQQRQIEAQQKPQHEDLDKKLQKYADLRQK